MIREYRTIDLEMIVELFARSVREIASRDYSSEQIAVWSPERPDAAAWGKRLSSGEVFVCERERRIAGFIRMEGECLDLLYVHPDFQRQGVARELFERVLSWAKEKGLARMTSEVSVTARFYFERVGFEMVEPKTVERHGVSLRNYRMILNMRGPQTRPGE